MSDPIQMDEWLKALQEAQASPDDSLSRRELEVIWGCTDREALARLRVLSGKGRLLPCRKWEIAIDGVRRPVSSYKLKPKGEQNHA